MDAIATSWPGLRSTCSIIGRVLTLGSAGWTFVDGALASQRLRLERDEGLLPPSASSSSLFLPPGGVLIQLLEPAGQVEGKKSGMVIPDSDDDKEDDEFSNWELDDFVEEGVELLFE